MVTKGTTLGLFGFSFQGLTELKEHFPVTHPASLSLFLLSVKQITLFVLTLFISFFFLIWGPAEPVLSSDQTEFFSLSAMIISTVAPCF